MVLTKALLRFPDSFFFLRQRTSCSARAISTHTGTLPSGIEIVSGVQTRENFFFVIIRQIGTLQFFDLSMILLVIDDKRTPFCRMFPAAPAREDGRWFSPRRHRSKAHTLLFFHFQTDIHQPKKTPIFRLFQRCSVYRSFFYLNTVPIVFYSSLPDHHHTLPHPPNPGKCSNFSRKSSRS